MGYLKEPPARVSKSSESSCSGDDEAVVVAMEASGRFSEVLEGIGVEERENRVMMLFEVCVKAHISFFWKAMFVHKKLYVDVPALDLPSCSKQSFVSLLEYAEDFLHCSHVIVCFKKERPDRENLIRVFKFMGFQVVCPSFVPSPALLHMAYTITPDSDDDDSDEEE